MELKNYELKSGMQTSLLKTRYSTSVSYKTLRSKVFRAKSIFLFLSDKNKRHLYNMIIASSFCKKLVAG
jgi:hypothetical protein